MDDVITTQNPSTMLKMHEDAVVVIDREPGPTPWATEPDANS